MLISHFFLRNFMNFIRDKGLPGSGQGALLDTGGRGIIFEVDAVRRRLNKIEVPPTIFKQLGFQASLRA